MKKSIPLTLVLIFLVLTKTVISDELGVDIHGFISQGYLQSDHNNYLGESEDGSFEFNETGINFRTYLTDDLSLGLQFFARDLGDWGNDEIEVDWVFADYFFRNWLGFRTGSLKIDLGLYNKVRDIDAFRTSVLLPTCIYQESFREHYTGLKGVDLYGHLPGGFLYTLAYGFIPHEEDSALVQSIKKGIEIAVRDAMVTNYLAQGMNLAAATAAAQNDKIELPATNIDVDYSLNLALHWITPIDGLKLSVSYIGTKCDIFMDFYLNSTQSDSILVEIDEMSTNVFSIQYMFGETILSAEYSLGVIDIAGGAEGDVDQEGYYASVSHRLLGWVEVGLYYSEYFSNKDDKDGEKLKEEGHYPDYHAWLKDACLSTRFDINESWSFKLEGHKMNGINGITIESDESPFDTKKDWYLFATKFSYCF